MSRKKIMLDITPLQYGFLPNSARSGIFFTLKNVLTRLLKRDDIELLFNLNLEDAPNVGTSVSEVLKREFPEQREWILSRTFSAQPSRLRVFCLRQNARIARGKERFRNDPAIFFLLRAAYCLVNRVLPPLSRFWPGRSAPDPDVHYLSLMLDPPGYIKASIPPERRYLLLYDTIPLSLPEYASHQGGWFGDVIRNIDPASNYLAISRSTRDDFVRFFPQLAGKDIPVVHLAAAEYFHRVDDAGAIAAVREKYHIPAGKKIFFSHCSLAPHKNLEMLFRAFAEFYKTDSDWIMLFSGANIGEKMETLTAIAAESSLPETAFAFTGYVDDAELPVLYSIADVFCFVSRFEGFGLPVLEAMQCGCPCLVSNVTSLPEVAGDAAYLVSPTDLGDIVRGMKTLAGDAALRSELSRKGLERAKTFSWEKTAGQILEAIEKTDAARN